MFTYIDKNTNTESPPIFINIIPRGKRTSCTFGWFKEDQDSLNEFTSHLYSNLNGLQVLISNILCRRVENWIISPSFYNETISPIESQISKHLSTSFIYKGLAELDINLFK